MPLVAAPGEGKAAADVPSTHRSATARHALTRACDIHNTALLSHEQ